MGSNITKTIHKWRINPRKLALKRAKGKAGPPVVPPHQRGRVDVPLYDCVHDEPQYAQVNKKRKQNDDGLHYAEVQVLQSKSASSRGKLRQTQENRDTEYAILDFTSTKKPLTSSYSSSAEPADLFIPPGELYRPNIRVSKKKNVY